MTLRMVPPVQEFSTTEHRLRASIPTEAELPRIPSRLVVTSVPRVRSRRRYAQVRRGSKGAL
jgi:hypothetical protein